MPLEERILFSQKPRFVFRPHLTTWRSVNYPNTTTIRTSADGHTYTRNQVSKIRLSENEPGEKRLLFEERRGQGYAPKYREKLSLTPRQRAAAAVSFLWKKFVNCRTGRQPSFNEFLPTRRAPPHFPRERGQELERRDFACGLLLFSPCRAAAMGRNKFPESAGKDFSMQLFRGIPRARS